MDTQLHADDNGCDFSDTVARDKAMLEALDTQLVVIDDTNSECPNIYMDKDRLNKKDAEHMIDAFLKHLGFRGARVKWKRPKCYIMPIEFGFLASQSKS